MEGAPAPQRQENPLSREERGLELGSAPPWTQGALALDSVGRTSSEGCGLRRPHGTVTTPGAGRAAVARTGRVRTACQVRSGILSPRVTEGRARAVTGLAPEGQKLSVQSRQRADWGPRPPPGGWGLHRKYVGGRGGRSRSALRGVLGFGDAFRCRGDGGCENLVSGCSIPGAPFGMLRWGVLTANS